MDRRVFLATVAAGVVAAGASVFAGYELAGPTAVAAPLAPPVPTIPPRARPLVMATPTPLPPHFIAPNLTKVALPHGTITSLPGKGNAVALTVDDGDSSEVVGLYAEFARKTGMRITFFLNGSKPAWTDNAAALRPLVDSGQVQLANHTWSHPNLQKLTDGGIVSELSKNDDFIQKMYGVDPKPFFRPPFGYHDARVDSVARGIGYGTPTLWYGSLSDSGLITDDQLKGFADLWMLPQHIVIGHANFITVTHCFDYLVDVIHNRGLVPVTLNDYFSR